MRYSRLFTPITLNQVVLRNRIVSTAHAEVIADEHGLPGERYLRYYEEKAKGGLGLAICGGSSIVSPDSPQGWWRSVNLSTDRVIEPLGRLAEAMHRHGARIMIQATHMGRRSSWHGEHWPHLVSPSGVREPVHQGNAKTIEPEEIRRIIADFAAAARRVQAAGMDGIEISAAHQHLIDQFWSPRTNFRTDEYGGCLENRLRFGMQVLQAVREAVGKDFCVGLRMCGDEFHEDGLNHDMLKEIAQAMAETSLIDYLSVIGSGADTHNTLANCMPPMALPPEPFVHLSAGIKSVVKIPVMHAQSIRDANQAERVLASGAADLVGMTRAQIADPHMVVKIRDGREDEIKQCVGANYCIDRQYDGLDVLCVQNAATTRETTMPHRIVPTRAGAAGSWWWAPGRRAWKRRASAPSAAMTWCCWKATPRWAGRSCWPPKRRSASRWRASSAGSTLKSSAWASTAGWDRPPMRTMCAHWIPTSWCWPPAGAAMCTTCRPGAWPTAWPSAPGTCWPAASSRPGACWSMTASAPTRARGGRLHRQPWRTGRSGDAGHQGFRERGRHHLPIFYRRLYAQQVVLTPNTWLERVSAEGDKRIALLRNEYTDEREEREVDQVVIENGIIPNDALYGALKSQSVNLGQTDIHALYAAEPQPALAEPTGGGRFLLFRVGDCVSMHNIHGAIYDSLRLCKDF